MLKISASSPGGVDLLGLTSRIASHPQCSEFGLNQFGATFPGTEIPVTYEVAVPHSETVA